MTTLNNVKSSKVRLIAIILVVCSPPYIAECLRTRSTKWQLVGDPALEVLGALDVGSYTRFLGVYSRFDWQHPGPAIFFLLAIPSHIGTHIAMNVMYWTVFLNLLFVAMAIAFIWNSAGRLGALILGSCLILANINGIADVSSAWNPAIALPFFALFLIITMFAWSNHYALVWISLLGSVVIQLHVSYVIPVLTILLVLLIARVNQRKSGGVLFNSRELLFTFGTNFVVWCLPLWDQFFGSGNFERIFHHFVSNPENQVGYGRSSRIIAYHLLPRAPWNGALELVSFTQNSEVSALWLFLPAFFFLFLVWAARRHEPELRVAVLAIAMVGVAAFISIAKLTGTAFPYMYGWVRIVAAVFWGTTLYTGIRIIIRYFQKSRDVIQKLLVVSAVTTLGIATFMAYDRPVIQKNWMDAVTYLTPFALALVPPGEEVGIIATDYLIGIGDGILLQYELNNRHVRRNGTGFDKPDAVAARYGAQRVGLGSATIEVGTVMGISVKDFIPLGFVTIAGYDLKNGFARSPEVIDESGEVIYLMSRKIPAVTVGQ